MYIVSTDGLYYFIYRDRDTINDYLCIADEVFICNGECSAIRRHLLLELGIIE